MTLDKKKKIERVPIIVSESNYNSNHDTMMGGFVTIIDKKSGQVLVDKKEFTKIEGVKGKSNLILFSGREVAAQKMFNMDRVAGSNEKSYFIYWLGIGSGGADPADPLNPIEPQTHDTDLYNVIIMDSANPAYADGGKKKPFDNVEFLQDPENEDRWLIVKTQTTITENDANGYDINEAVLYLTDNTDPVTATNFIPWARVTFSTIRKYQQRELIFLWYIFF